MKAIQKIIYLSPTEAPFTQKEIIAALKVLKKTLQLKGDSTDFFYKLESSILKSCTNYKRTMIDEFPEVMCLILHF